VSRTFRATWYVQHLGQTVAIGPQDAEQVSDFNWVCPPVYECAYPLQGEGTDIQVLAVCEDNGNVVNDGGLVNPDTQVFYVCQQYSVVFVLDLSPNMRAVVGTQLANHQEYRM
jgi:hypothetical protein